MTFIIDPGVPLDAEIRRLVGSQLVRIERALTTSRDGADGTGGEKAVRADGRGDALSMTAGATRRAAIFDARKRLKKLRGLIRLVRDVAPRFYEEDNARYRRAAARLAPFRDANAVVEALDRLTAHYAGQIDRGVFAAVRGRLAGGLADQSEADDGDLNAALDATLPEIGEARHHIDGLVIKRSKKPAPILAKGFARSYGKARQALASVEENGTPERFHDLRKPLKYYWFHLRLLGPVWPELLSPLAAAAKGVVDDLGHDHDFEILRQAVVAQGDGAADPTAIASNEEMSLLFALLDRRQEELRRSALRGARRLLLLSPAANRKWMQHLYAQAAAEADGGGTPA